MAEYAACPYCHNPLSQDEWVKVVRCRDCLNAIADKHGTLDCHGPMVQVWDYFNDEPLRNPVPPNGFCAWGVRKEMDR